MTYKLNTNADHITNQAARVLIGGLRDQFSGFNKMYGSRYIRALAEVCKYNETDYYTYQIGLTSRKFASQKDAGVFMEKTINDLFDLGIMK
jgi:VIT1/CCC1 family predicted Fe2+/Mn2+ transporter